MEGSCKRVDEAFSDLSVLKEFLGRFQELTKEAGMDEIRSTRLMVGLIDISLDMFCPPSQGEHVMQQLWGSASLKTKVDIIRVMMTMTDPEGLFYRLSGDCFVKVMTRTMSGLISRLLPIYGH